jgi:thiol-disulfide isomerase/thioredoxin
MKKSALIITVAVVAFVGGISVRGLLSSPLDKEKVNQETQQKLSEFTLPDLSGKPRNIKEWQGKVLVINFWATWCPPCLKEMPEFEALHTKYENKGLQFIGIALDDADPVKEFIASKKITYPILLGEDQGTKLAHDLGNIVNTVPFTVIINKKGLVVKSHMGELSREQLLEIVKPLL